MYKICIIPQGSTLPEDIRHKLVNESGLLKRIVAGEHEEALIMVSTRELQMLVEYADLLEIQVRAIIGLQGAMYSTVWNTYVSTMERTSIDAYRAVLEDTNDARSEAGRASVLAPTRIDRMSRVPTKRLAEPDDKDPDAQDFAGDASA